MSKKNAPKALVVAPKVKTSGPRELITVEPNGTGTAMVVTLRFFVGTVGAKTDRKGQPIVGKKGPMRTYGTLIIDDAVVTLPTGEEARLRLSGGWINSKSGGFSVPIEVDLVPTTESLAAETATDDGLDF